MLKGVLPGEPFRLEKGTYLSLNGALFLPFGKLKVPSPIEGSFDFLKALSQIEGLKVSDQER